MIRRLKKLGANQEELLDIYFKQVRSILAVPVGCVKFPKSFRNFTASDFSTGV